MDSYLARWLPLTGLALFAALALGLLQPPRPLPANAPATEFSAMRALREVAVIAREPHAVGTPANATVRDYLLRRCRELGLQAVVQDTSVAASSFGQVVAGRVQNIVARQPGRTPGGPAVLVLAHYDSQPQAPGAGDNGAGVAALLETIRALRAGPPLAHDIIWLFTDGEEAGLLGARAYAADTVRLRREVGVVLNLEGRGNQGPVSTFEVSAENGWVVREFARAAPAPLASSLFYEVYRHLPNDTDFTPLRKAGLTGLNSAFTGGLAYYHSPADTPANLDPASLQHHGVNLLALVRHFATIPLTNTKAPDYSFFNPLGKWLVCYPASWNLPLTLLTIALLLLTVIQARRQHRLSWASLLGGALAWLGITVLALAAGWAMLTLVAKTYPEYRIFYSAAAYSGMTYGTALLALAAAVFTAAYVGLSRLVRPDSLTGGALVVVALLLGLLQWQAASSAFLLALPLLAATLAWAWRLRRGAGRLEPRMLPKAGPVAVLLALPVVALLSPIPYFLLITFCLQPLVLVAVFFLAVLLGLLLPVLLPVLAAPAGRFTGGRPGQAGASRSVWAMPGLALVIALSALGWGHAHRQPTADKPLQTHLFYTLDADHQQGYWLSSAKRSDAWTAHVFTKPHYGPLPAPFPPTDGPVLWQAAKARVLPAPEIQVLTEQRMDGGRQLRLLLMPGRAGVTQLSARLTGLARLRTLRLAGHSLPLPVATGAKPAGQPASTADFLPLTFFAPSAAGEVLELTLADRAPLEISLTTRSLGLPTEPALPTRPASLVPAPGNSSFTTQVRRAFRL
ncbi:MAG: M20/M25/M40 family metallo-hydrolase [Bacteroidota bacterium]|nr:M20/M25/M40 family metallo-hydrolase [Bacteroidota bacterium]